MATGNFSQPTSVSHRQYRPGNFCATLLLPSAFAIFRNFAARQGLVGMGAFMSKKKILRFTAAVFLLSAGSLVAQTTSGAPPYSQPNRVRQEPCWRQAGISSAVFEQRQAIERDAHSQVSSVCADTSLTPQQKLARVREIREQAQQKTGELITPDQEKALTACRQQRNANHAGGGMHEGGNPCGQGRGEGANGNPGGNSGAGGSNPQN
jgi:Spy/CpxP family protein refolding chaperone